MNIVTLMNYDWSCKNNISLCLSWVKQANDWLNPKDKVIIMSEKDLPTIIKEFISKSRIEFSFNIYVKQPKHYVIIQNILKNSGLILDNRHVSFYEKLFILDNIDYPYVFIDADAFITNDLKPLRLAFKSGQPLILSDHERDIKGHTDAYPPFPNSGVMVVNDPEKKFFNIDHILSYGQSTNFRYFFPGTFKQIPGFDQSLIFLYCLTNNYDYHSPYLTPNQNACAIRVEYYLNGNKWSARDKFTKEDITISHHWWKFKPWGDKFKIDCPFFDKTLIEVQNI
jgi:hypothetical protein